ncbi:small multi-drug export protein [Candidatus Woesearchaeota archaeon]|nr:small multi-drug export protein [Candidatus Woesearchaeota archaeon]
MTLLSDILIIAAITFIPFLELRASIPYGILVLKMHWLPVFAIASIANIILGPIVYFFLDKLIHIFLRIKFIDKIYQKYVEKTQKNIHKYVEKYGELAVAVFIGIPLPGSGSYSGALASYLIGLGYKKFIIANIIGVLIAGIIVTAVVVTGINAFDIFVKI